MSSTHDETVGVTAHPPSLAVVERVANCERVRPTDLVPLYETIDPDALDGLVDHRDRNAAALRIEFTYHGYDVTVTGDGVVHLAREHPVDG